MKFVRYSVEGSVSFGTLEEQNTMIRQIDGSPFTVYEATDKTHDLKSVRLLEPVVPSKIVAVGLNYIDHAQELGMALPENPLLFLKPPSSLLATDDSIVYPAMSNQVEYEAELAIVIKEVAKQIDVNKAVSYVLGYTCSNDVTARDLQKKDGQWTRAKSFDTFSPIGPCIETDVDPKNLNICLKLNGEVMQSSTTANMIFKPDYLVSFISHVMILYPGDVIFTGTPPGVGQMQIGDTVEVSIEGIGTLTNRIIGP